MSTDIIRIAQALDFAAKKHVHQCRKGKLQEPYINHLTEVALLLAEATGGKDANLVIAGLLHDCIEDQDVTHQEIARSFGEDVANLVAEVTDDKSQHKQERKRLQVETAASKTERARLLKIADKTANLRSILHSPPDGWDEVRKKEYFEWAKSVVDNCRGINPLLEQWFDEVYARY
jgi:(p)ppGpp synthase/HD superfamily hydrolase